MTVEDLLAADRFAARLGARLVAAAPERVEVEMDLAPHHRDANGDVSAGALFGLADCAMSLISNAERTSLAVATHFTRAEVASKAATVRAVAVPALPLGDTPSTWDIDLVAEDTVIGHFTGTTLAVE